MQVNFDPGQFFSGVKTGSMPVGNRLLMLVCRPCECTSGNLNKTSVREKSRGVYLPIGWVFPSYLMIFLLCQTWEDYAWLWIVLSVPRKSVISKWCWQAELRYVVAWLSCCTKMFCASHKTFRRCLAWLIVPCWKTNSRLRKIGSRSSFSGLLDLNYRPVQFADNWRCSLIISLPKRLGERRF